MQNFAKKILKNSLSFSVRMQMDEFMRICIPNQSHTTHMQKHTHQSSHAPADAGPQTSSKEPLDGAWDFWGGQCDSTPRHTLAHKGAGGGGRKWSFSRENWFDQQQGRHPIPHGKQKPLCTCLAGSRHSAPPPAGDMALQYDLLKKAVAAHVAYMKVAKDGKGVDRHLFGLRMMYEREGRPAGMKCVACRAWSIPLRIMSESNVL